MITVFTIPKKFEGGHIEMIQRNAIKSWLALAPDVEVILFGNDPGVDRIAREFNLLHIPEIRKNNYGTPILSSVIETAQKKARHKTIVYINADIIVLKDFISALKKIEKEKFFMIGQRWDLDLKEPLDFKDESRIRQLLKEQGKMHGPLGMDYFAIPRDLELGMPEFAVGRPAWDNWLIFRMRSLNIPVIDATGSVTAIHQNHDYSHSAFGGKKRVAGPELKEAIKMAGGFTNMLTLRDAYWLLDEKGLVRPRFPKRIYSLFSLFYPWRLALAFKRQLQQLIQ